MVTTEGNPISYPKYNFKALLPWLKISHVSGMHSRLFNRLLTIYSTPENILACDFQTLRTAGVKNSLALEISQIGQGKQSIEMNAALERCFNWLKCPGNFLITRPSPHYPSLLTFIPDPPPMLYVKGKLESLHLPLIAMVGSRKPSAGGRRDAQHFARELAANGLGVVSGLAMGIDLESHRGAIAGGMTTVAILGTGIDIIYPAVNRAMFAAVAENGALVSEFNPGTPARPQHFPQRNRIISGLSQGVLVVEAGVKSGSMITARFALEQGREVFAIPGSIHNPMARGCHKLIAEGAKLVQCVEDILDEKLLLAEQQTAESIGTAISKESGSLHLTEPLQKVKQAVGFDTVSVDQIVLETQLNVKDVTVALVELELRGLVRRENNGYTLIAC